MNDLRPFLLRETPGRQPLILGIDPAASLPKLAVTFCDRYCFW